MLEQENKDISSKRRFQTKEHSGIMMGHLWRQFIINLDRLVV